jgi:dolichol-phosphate mannosyltransferase
MPRRVLITGGSGFVGANLTRRALRDGHEVHLLLRPGHDDWRLRDLDGQLFRHAVDVTVREAVAAAVAAIRPEWVFHLAAYGAYPRQTGIEAMTATNLLGCAHLVDACADVGVNAFINAGSSSEYGFKAGAASEGDRLEPNSQYAITKAAATHYCQLAARTRGMHVVTLRLYSVYGPFEAPERLVPTLLLNGLQRALPPLANPDTARDFVFVDDVVDAMLRVAGGRRAAPAAVYNVCSGAQTTLREIVDSVRDELGIGAEPRWGTLPSRSWDTDAWVGSPAALASDYGWRASTPLIEGLRRTIDWLRGDRSRRRFYEEHVFERISTAGNQG